MFKAKRVNLVKASISTLVLIFLLSYGAGFAQTMSDYVKWSNENYPELAQKVEKIASELKKMASEVKADKCRSCNNVAGTLENAAVTVEQLYYALGRMPQYCERRVDGVLRSFNNFDRRMKWNLTETPNGQERYKHWTSLKNEFNALVPEVKKAIKGKCRKSF